MGTVSPTQVVDGTGIDASDVNSPINTIANEFNGNIDNTNIKTGAAIATAKLATDAGIVGGMITNSTITSSKLSTGAAADYVATNETTTSTSYTALSTAGPSVTVTIGVNGLALVSIYAKLSTTADGGVPVAALDISGATTTAASDIYSISFSRASSTGADNYRIGATFLITGLAAGSTTFKLLYKRLAATGTAAFQDRRISVVPL